MCCLAIMKVGQLWTLKFEHQTKIYMLEKNGIAYSQSKNVTLRHYLLKWHYRIHLVRYLSQHPTCAQMICLTSIWLICAGT